MINRLTRQGIIAALYVVISVTLAPISFGAIQFRMAEMFMVLPFYNKRHTIGLTLGCLITNMFSPMGLADVVFGTAGTFFLCLLVSSIYSKIYIPIAAGLIVGPLIGAELYFLLGLPFLFSALTVGIGELVVVAGGVFVCSLLEKNRLVMSYLKE